MKKVELLQRAGVTPLIVFDGGRLPMKGEEEASRARQASLRISTLKDTLTSMKHWASCALLL